MTAIFWIIMLIGFYLVGELYDNYGHIFLAAMEWMSLLALPMFLYGGYMVLSGKN